MRNEVENQKGCRNSTSEPVCLHNVKAGGLKTSLSSELILLQHSPAGEVHNEGPVSPGASCIFLFLFPSDSSFQALVSRSVWIPGPHSRLMESEMGGGAQES